MATKISDVTLKEIVKAVYGDTFVWISKDEVLGLCDTTDLRLITTISIGADYDVYVQWYPSLGNDRIINAIMQGFICGIIRVWLSNYHIEDNCFNEENSYIKFVKNKN